MTTGIIRYLPPLRRDGQRQPQHPDGAAILVLQHHLECKQHTAKACTALVERPLPPKECMAAVSNQNQQDATQCSKGRNQPGEIFAAELRLQYPALPKQRAHVHAQVHLGEVEKARRPYPCPLAVDYNRSTTQARVVGLRAR